MDRSLVLPSLGSTAVGILPVNLKKKGIICISQKQVKILLCSSRSTMLDLTHHAMMVRGTRCGQTDRSLSKTAQHPDNPYRALEVPRVTHAAPAAADDADRPPTTGDRDEDVGLSLSRHDGKAEMKNAVLSASASSQGSSSHALTMVMSAVVVAVCHDHVYVSAATTGGAASRRAMGLSFKPVRPALALRDQSGRTRRLSALAAAKEQISSTSCVGADGTATSSSGICGDSPKPPSSIPSYLLSVRGGGLDEDYYDEYDEDSDYDFDDDDFAFDEDDMEAAEDDFGEGGLGERLLAAYEKTPPFTKAYLTASAAVTALGYLTNGNQFPDIFLLDWKGVLTKMQIWRPLTAFLNIGPFGLGYAMTAQFVWTYMATLERMNHSHPYDFWLMILFGCASMVAGYSFLKIPPTFLGHNLSTFLVYVWSRYHEGLEVNMFELFNARAEMLPWLFLAQTFLLEGVFPTLDLLGILFGHIYHHLWTTNALKAPKFVINWYNGDSASGKAIREKYKTISSDFEMEGQ